MPKGFFSKSQLVSSAPLSNIPLCGICQLFKHCRSPKMKVSGEGKRKILICGESPGQDEDSKGIQFCGVTGKLLENTLAKYGIDLRKDCWLTNATICRAPSNRTPSSEEISYCRPNLLNTIKALKPEIIVPLGGVAVESIMSWLWKKDKEKISRWAGFRIPHQKLNAWICPTFHPSYITRQQKNGKKINPHIEIIWRRHLKEISKLSGRPWKVVPDYKKQVEIILDERKAAERIRDIIKKGGRAAFDYECNSLKPEWPGTEIVCASICLEGTETIAFPMSKEGGPTWWAMKEFILAKSIKKICSNMKYEDRWTRRKLYFKVNRLWHDTMNCAHIIDCREGITGLKFQAFAMLGQEPYNTHIENLLQAKKGSKLNQITKDIEIRDLLLYCGMDSICEYHLAIAQRKVLGLKT